MFTHRRKAVDAEVEVCSYTITASMLSDKGYLRDDNQDQASYACPQPPCAEARRGILAIVADGMGGHAAGEVASRMAVHMINRKYYQSIAEPHKALKDVFSAVNRHIYHTAQCHPEYQSMGTTCTCLILRGAEAYCAHVGDSRLYLVRGGAIYLMTEDHSVTGQMLRQGLITREQARQHADKHVLLRALGTRPQIAVSTWGQPLPVKADDRFILCTDGLSDLVHEDDIKAITLVEEPATACEKLIALAKTRGGYDNITVGVVHVKAAAPSGSPEDVQPQYTIAQPTSNVARECQP
jgi:protein phosphatase